VPGVIWFAQQTRWLSSDLSFFTLEMLGLAFGLLLIFASYGLDPLGSAEMRRRWRRRLAQAQRSRRAALLPGDPIRSLGDGLTATPSRAYIAVVIPKFMLPP
jgi:hypothetical protein